jgi:hypothetical protein
MACPLPGICEVSRSKSCLSRLPRRFLSGALSGQWLNEICRNSILQHLVVDILCELVPYMAANIRKGKYLAGSSCLQSLGDGFPDAFQPAALF